MRGEITIADAFPRGRSSVEGRAPGAGAARSRRPSVRSVELARNDARELLQRLFEAVVDDDVAELRLGGELLLGDLQAPLDLLGVVGAAADQPRAQRLERRRSDEHLHRLGHRRADLTRALHLDLEYDRRARLHTSLELRAQRAV